jgi:hypothetical protein
MKVARLTSSFVEDQHRHWTFAGDFLGHASYHPAFDTSVTVAAHHDEISLVELSSR